MNNVLKPHQKKRIESLINPNADPLGQDGMLLNLKLLLVQVAF